MEYNEDLERWVPPLNGNFEPSDRQNFKREVQLWLEFRQNCVLRLRLIPNFLFQVSLFFFL